MLDLDILTTNRQQQAHDEAVLAPVRARLEQIRSDAAASSFPNRASRAVVRAMDEALAALNATPED